MLVSRSESATRELGRALDALPRCGLGRLHDGRLGDLRPTDPLLHAEPAGRFHDPHVDLDAAMQPVYDAQPSSARIRYGGGGGAS